MRYIGIKLIGILVATCILSPVGALAQLGAEDENNEISNVKLEVGPKVGVPFGDISDLGGNMFFGADARVKFEGFPVYFGSSFGIYNTKQVTRETGDIEYDLSLDTYTLDLNILYGIREESKIFKPYIGVGVAFTSNQLSTRYGRLGDIYDDIRGNNFGVNLIGGLQVKTGPIEPFLQLDSALGSGLSRFGIASGFFFSF